LIGRATRILVAVQDAGGPSRLLVAPSHGPIAAVEDSITLAGSHLVLTAQHRLEHRKEIVRLDLVPPLDASSEL
jgi:hypothetical protein